MHLFRIVMIVFFSISALSLWSFQSIELYHIFLDMFSNWKDK